MDGDARVRRVAELFWIRLPRSALRLSGLGAVALSDGSYLRAWPRPAAAAPPAAVLLGLATGILHPDDLYTYSLTVMSLMGVVSALGAGLGCWALAGFAVGDLLFGREGSSYLELSPGTTGVRTLAALLLSYVLLAGLLVLAPVLASTVRLAVRDWAERRGVTAPLPGGALLSTHVAAAFLWTQSTPFLIRPVWSYFGRSPVVPAIEPLQQRGWILALAVAVGVGSRLYLEGRAERQLDPLAIPALAGGLRKPAPVWAAVAGRTLFVTFLLSGLLTRWFGVVLTIAALAAIFLLQVRVLPSVPAYVQTLTRIPLGLRVVASVVLAYTAGTLLVEPAVNRGAQSFAPLVLAALASLLVIAVLLPESARAPAQPLQEAP